MDTLKSFWLATEDFIEKYPRATLIIICAFVFLWFVVGVIA